MKTTDFNQLLQIITTSSIHYHYGTLELYIIFKKSLKAALKRLTKRLRMIDGIVSGENDHGGIIEAIPKRKAEDVIQVIRSHQPSKYIFSSR